MKRLIIATKNKKKLHELRRYLKGIKADVVSLLDFDGTPRIVENGLTFKANAVKKAVKTARFVKGLAIADDSGLVVKALGGRPGVRSSRFAGPRKSDKENNARVLHLLEGVPPNKRQAKFVCAVAIVDGDKVVKVIEKDVSGLIAFEPRGKYGFGYDPLFLIPKYGKTFGQLGLKVKDRMSHRSKALREARKFLKQYLKIHPGRSAAG